MSEPNKTFSQDSQTQEPNAPAQGGNFPSQGGTPPQYGGQPPSPPPSWGQGAPYRPQGQSGGYYREEGYRQYPPYPDQNQRRGDPSQWTPYQYNANSGWQQPVGQSRYEWNYNDYDKYDSGTKTKKRKGHGFLIFFVCLLGSLSIGLVVITMFSLIGAPQSVPADRPVQSSVPVASLPEEEASAGPGVSLALELASKPQVSQTVPVDGPMTIPQVAEYVSPSVVSVVRYRENQIYSEATGIGSGIILTEDGYIVTNAHVIEGGSTFKIQLNDGTPYDASLIGYDTFTDLAVLKASATGLRPAELGDSSDLMVGETVVAIGNPVDLSFAGSVTRGIVSAVNREVNASRYNVTYIQTDAAINPGNSGGALANEFGQVIGINTAKIFRAGYEGMGFAIPISQAKPIIDDLLMYGWVTGRVKLGIEGLSIDAVDAGRGNLMEGIIIKSIDPDSDLNNHNIIKDDIITHVNGTRVYNTDDIHNAIDEFGVGDEVELSIYRRSSPTSDSEFTVSVKLIESKG